MIFKYVIYILEYIVLCIIWSIYCGYKQRKVYKKPFNCWKNVKNNK